MKMEIVTITDKAKKTIAELCNESVVVEYDLILNYPRIIDHIVNFEKIKDEQLIKDIDRLGSESLGHFSTIDRIIRNLGGTPVWLTGTLPRVVDVADILERQLGKEEAVRDLYKEAKKVAMNSRTTIKVGGFWDRLKGIDISERNIISYQQLVNDLDRLILDEERHIRLAKDSIATFKALAGK